MILLTTALFIVCCLFREDFGDAYKSCVSPISIVASKLGLVEDAYSQTASPVGSFINLLWFGLIGLQIFGLIRTKTIKTEVQQRLNKQAP